MSAAVYILAAVVVVLLIALVLCWMQPRRKAKASTGTMSAGTLTIDIECDPAQALARIAEVTAAVERLDAAQRKAGLNLPVRDMATGGTLPQSTHVVTSWMPFASPLSTPASPARP